MPPEVCEEMVRCIANQFITERNSGEVMSVGLNTVREVASRNPLAIGDDLLQDLTQVILQTKYSSWLFINWPRQPVNKKKTGSETGF